MPATYGAWQFIHLTDNGFFEKKTIGAPSGYSMKKFEIVIKKFRKRRTIAWSFPDLQM